MKGSNSEVIETTLGDLVEAITQIALEAGKTTEEGYKLASLTLESILKRNSKEIPGLWA
ncbi:MAG: hypothetical protein KDD42_03145 [Bdellovibrionales bacterium]|nr:hypothetical protein [Bdellovibrionales bacterium]